MRRASLETDEMPPDDRSGGMFELPDRVAHYFRDVLRLDPGDEVELFDGTGKIVRARLEKVSERRVIVSIQQNRRSEATESPAQITLVQAIPKGKRWETLLEKVTELGVSRIIPLESRRTVVQIKDSKVERKLDRWTRVIGAAAKQCRRTVTPEITAPASLEEGLEQTAGCASFVAHTDGRSKGLRALIEDGNARDVQTPNVAVWVGPEGGFHQDEIERLRDEDVQSFAMGPRILRSETAGIVAVTLLQAYLGDLDP